MDERLRGTLSRDDLDRLLVAAGLVVTWFVPWWLAGGQELRSASVGALLLYGMAPPILLGLAAFLMWRNVAALRLPLVVVALGVAAGLALVALGGEPGALVAAAGALAVSLGAWRMRVPPERARSAGGVPSDAAAGDRPAALDVFSTRASRLSPEETRALHAAWRAVDPAARERAWTSVRRDVAGTPRAALLESVRHEIELWGRAAGGSPWTWEFGTMVDVDRSNLRRAAMPALLDAAAAILLADRLSVADRDTLIGPWEAVVEAEPATRLTSEADAPD